MAQKIAEVMTRDIAAVDGSAPVTEAARTMRDRDIGNVVVVDERNVAGIVTDRDIVVRAVADGRALSDVMLRDIASTDVTAVDPGTGVDDALQLMRERALRRLLVVEDGAAVGIVSIGDLARERDADAALAGISQAPPNT
jgi:CBS domain-containing protein